MSYQNPPPHAADHTAAQPPPARRWGLQVSGLLMIGGLGLAVLPITDRLWGIKPAWHQLPAIGGLLAFASIIYRQRHPGFWGYSGTPKQRLINVFAVIAVLAAVFVSNAALAN